MGLVCLNAGVVCAAPFRKMPKEMVQTMLAVNALQVIYMAKVIHRQLGKRSYKRSGIVITSSSARSFIMTGLQLYSACKNFSSFVGEAINWEFASGSGRIDVLTYEAGPVDTKMVREFQKQKSFNEVSAQKAARSCFSDVGYRAITSGTLLHDLNQNYMLPLIPKYPLQILMFKEISKIHEQSKI